MTEDTSPENLRKFLESDDPAMVRMGISMAKGAKVSESYYFIMALSLWNSDEEIREAAGELVEEIGIEKIINKEADNSTTEGILVSQFQRKKAVIPLIMALGSPVGQVRRSAAGTLGEIGDARAVEPLIGVLCNVKMNHFPAADALKMIGKPAVEPLIKVLSDDVATDPNIIGPKNKAAEALGKIGDKRAVEPLIKALGDYDVGVREAATYALGEIGDRRAVEPIIELLGDEDSDIRLVPMRVYAAEALGKIGDAHAIKPLIKLLGIEDNEWRYFIREALRKLGHEVE